MKLFSMLKNPPSSSYTITRNTKSKFIRILCLFKLAKKFGFTNRRVNGNNIYIVFFFAAYFTSDKSELKKKRKKKEGITSEMPKLSQFHFLYSQFFIFFTDTFGSVPQIRLIPLPIAIVIGLNYFCS